MAFFLKLAKNCCNPLVSQAQEEALTETVLDFETSSLRSPTNRYGKGWRATTANGIPSGHYAVKAALGGKFGPCSN